MAVSCGLRRANEVHVICHISNVFSLGCDRAHQAWFSGYKMGLNWYLWLLVTKLFRGRNGTREAGETMISRRSCSRYGSYFYKEHTTGTHLVARPVGSLITLFLPFACFIITIVITVPADGRAPVGAKLSAGIVMTIVIQYGTATYMCLMGVFGLHKCHLFVTNIRMKYKDSKWLPASSPNYRVLWPIHIFMNTMAMSTLLTH